jgi:hypothetical protein
MDEANNRFNRPIRHIPDHDSADDALAGFIGMVVGILMLAGVWVSYRAKSGNLVEGIVEAVVAIMLIVLVCIWGYYDTNKKY